MGDSRAGSGTHTAIGAMVVSWSMPFLTSKFRLSMPARAKCGQWKMVDTLPDLKIRFVNALPDLKIRYGNAFPGPR